MSDTLAPNIAQYIPKYEYYNTTDANIVDQNNKSINVNQYVSDNVTQNSKLKYEVILLDSINKNKITDASVKIDTNGEIVITPTDSSWFGNGYIRLKVTDEQNNTSEKDIAFTYNLEAESQFSSLQPDTENTEVLFSVYDPNGFFINTSGSIISDTSYSLFDVDSNINVTADYNVTVVVDSTQSNKYTLGFKNKNDNNNLINLQLRIGNQYATDQNNIFYQNAVEFYQNKIKSGVTIQEFTGNSKISGNINSKVFINSSDSIITLTIDPILNEDGEVETWDYSATVFNAYDDKISFQLNEKYYKYSGLRFDGGTAGINIQFSKTDDAVAFEDLKSKSLIDSDASSNQYMQNIAYIDMGSGNDILDMSSKDSTSMFLAYASSSGNSIVYANSLAIYGGTGNDILMSGNNPTSITGGTGADTIVCGIGQDTVIYSSASDSNITGGVDKIMNLSTDDLIDIGRLSVQYWFNVHITSIYDANGDYPYTGNIWIDIDDSSFYEKNTDLYIEFTGNNDITAASMAAKFDYASKSEYLSNRSGIYHQIIGKAGYSTITDTPLNDLIIPNGLATTISINSDGIADQDIVSLSTKDAGKTITIKNFESQIDTINVSIDNFGIGNILLFNEYFVVDINKNGKQDSGDVVVKTPNAILSKDFISGRTNGDFRIADVSIYTPPNAAPVFYKDKVVSFDTPLTFNPNEEKSFSFYYRNLNNSSEDVIGIKDDYTNIKDLKYQIAIFDSANVEMKSGIDYVASVTNIFLDDNDKILSDVVFSLKSQNLASGQYTVNLSATDNDTTSLTGSIDFVFNVNTAPVIDSTVFKTALTIDLSTVTKVDADKIYQTYSGFTHDIVSDDRDTDSQLKYTITNIAKVETINNIKVKTSSGGSAVVDSNGKISFSKISSDVQKIEFTINVEDTNGMIASKTMEASISRGIDKIFYGTKVADAINGNVLDNTIYGGSTATTSQTDNNNIDTIQGKEGDDLIYAGSDNDTIYGDSKVSNSTEIEYVAGNDEIHGGSGNDVICGDFSATIINDPDINTFIYSISSATFIGSDKNCLYGTDGDNTINGDNDSNKNDYIEGKGGKDTINPGAGDNIINGGFGADTINLSSSSSSNILIYNNIEDFYTQSTDALGSIYYDYDKITAFDSNRDRITISPNITTDITKFTKVNKVTGFGATIYFDNNGNGIVNYGEPEINIEFVDAASRTAFSFGRQLIIEDNATQEWVGGGKNVTEGTYGDDTLDGDTNANNINDYIEGKDGNDDITPGEGYNVVYAGKGADNTTLFDGSMNILIYKDINDGLSSVYVHEDGNTYQKYEAIDNFNLDNDVIAISKNIATSTSVFKKYDWGDSATSSIFIDSDNDDYADDDEFFIIVYFKNYTDRTNFKFGTNLVIRDYDTNNVDTTPYEPKHAEGRNLMSGTTANNTINGDTTFTNITGSNSGSTINVTTANSKNYVAGGDGVDIINISSDVTANIIYGGGAGDVVNRTLLNVLQSNTIVYKNASDSMLASPSSNLGVDVIDFDPLRDIIQISTSVGDAYDYKVEDIASISGVTTTGLVKLIYIDLNKNNKFDVGDFGVYLDLVRNASSFEARKNIKISNNNLEGKDDYILGDNGNDTITPQGGNNFIQGGLGGDTIIISDTSTFNTIAYSSILESINDDSGGRKLDIIENFRPGCTQISLSSTINYATLLEIITNYSYNGTDYTAISIDSNQNNSRDTTDFMILLDMTPSNLALFDARKDIIVSDNIFNRNTYSDRIYGDNGNDIIRGGVGNDFIDGGSDNDQIYGDDGNDVITGGAGNDTIYGGDGDDVIDGGAGDDVIEGGEGNDLINSGRALSRLGNVSPTGVTRDQIYGDAGDDTIHSYGANNNLVYGGSGNDKITVYNGNSNLIYGDAGDDVITMENEKDNIIYGDDLANTVSGNDTIRGGSGNDTIRGGKGNDTIYGGSGDNVLEGGDGNDELFDGVTNDIFYGGLGGDKLHSSNQNSITSDIFVYTSKQDSFFDSSGTNYDIIYDYNIDINNIITFATEIAENTTKFKIMNFNATNKYFRFLIDENGNSTVDDGEFMIDVYYKSSVGIIDTNDITFAFLDKIEFNVPYPFYNVDSSGRNIINGTNGDDTLDGTALSDSIDGLGGNDIINGKSGDDNLVGGDGNDTIDGGDGNDIIYAYLINSVTIATSQSDVISGGNGDDKMYGSNGVDTMYGQADDDELYGYNGHDIIDGGDGNDTIYGGDGNDIISTGKWNRQSDSSEYAVNTVYGESGNDKIDGDDSADSIYGGEGNDIINGNNGQDSLYGGNGDDNINGGAGNDVISGDDTDSGHLSILGNDTIDGGEGNDTIYGGGGGDTISGGYGDDMIFSDDIYGNVAGRDTVHGGEGNDTIFGGGDIDSLYGDGGDDMVNGDDGSDTIYGDSANVSNLLVVGNDTLSGGDGNDKVYGCGGNDIINGDDGSDTIYGGLGNDTIDGGEGNDTIYGGEDNDVINGWNGNDTIYADDDILTKLSSGNNTIDGGAGDDTIYASVQNNDTIYGGAGNDTIYIENGNANIYGGFGNDKMLSYSGSNVARTGLRSYYYNAIEESKFAGYNATGNGSVSCDFIDDFSCSSLNDVIHIGAGFMFVAGANFVVTDISSKTHNAKDRLLFYDADKDGDVDYGEFAIWVRLRNTVYTISLTSNIVIDYLTGTDADDTIYGTDVGDTIIGKGGNDYLYGNGGDDEIQGDAGNDVIEGGVGNDVIEGGVGNDNIKGGYGDNTIQGDAGNDIINGGYGNDIVYGGDGDDILDSDIGSYDQLYGEAGDDKLSGHNNGVNEIKQILFQGGTGNDMIDAYDSYGEIDGGDGDDYITSTVYQYAYTTEKKITIKGGGGDDYIIGSVKNDIIYGGIVGNANMKHTFYQNYKPTDIELYDDKYSDVIFAGAGDDTVDCTEDNLADYIDGGTGNNTVSGGGGNDYITTGDGDDVVNSGSGNDTILCGNAVTKNTVHGNAGNDVIYAGAGVDEIYGDGGNDVIYASAGNDVIEGGDGNDVIEGGNGDDVIYGYDSANYDGTGNDIIYGGSGNDTIYGDNSSPGSTRIIGGTGIDNIHCDDAADDIFYNTNDSEFTSTIRLYDEIFNFKADGTDQLHFTTEVLGTWRTGLNARYNLNGTGKSILHIYAGNNGDLGNSSTDISSDTNLFYVKVYIDGLIAGLANNTYIKNLQDSGDVLDSIILIEDTKTISDLYGVTL